MLARQRTTPPDHTATLPAKRRTAWALLATWLLYSAAALGWHLAHDPLLSTYICRTK